MKQQMKTYQNVFALVFIWNFWKLFSLKMKKHETFQDSTADGPLMDDVDSFKSRADYDPLDYYQGRYFHR